jgi:acetyl esterase
MATAAARLDPQARDLLDVIRASGLPPLYDLSVAEARERVRASLVGRGRAQVPLHSVEERACPSPHGPVPLRLYRPTEGTPPLALFIRGGGFTLNDLDTHDRLCRLLARRSGFLIAALDYRRAPEHQHPAPLEDAQVAYRWLLDQAAELGCAPGCRAVIGESSGGMTAAALVLLLRDGGAPLPDFQVLAYPIADVFGRQPAYEERGDGYLLSRPELTWFFDNYLPAGQSLDDPYLFPMVAPDHRGLPDTLVVTAEFDPLRDDGIAYAEKLSAAGVAVEHLHASDQLHGFLLLDGAIAGAGAWIDRLGDALSRRSAQPRRQPAPPAPQSALPAQRFAPPRSPAGPRGAMP